MRTDLAVGRRWLCAGLGMALGLGVVLFAAGRGRARATDDPDSGPPSDQVVAKARALVGALETRLRATESNLQLAREVLARLEAERTARRADPAREVVETGAVTRDADGDDLVGIWRVAGVRGRGGEYQKAPYDEYKIMTADHYLWMSFDPGTGRVLRAGGGSYSLEDGIYTAHVDYSNSADLRAIVGQEYRFECKIAGDRWYHAGPMPNGAYVDELWERINKPQ